MRRNGVSSTSSAIASTRERPFLSIEPPRRNVPLRLDEIWQYRELLYFLVWRDVKVRYKQTVLGVAWAVLQPLAATLVFTLFFGRLAGMPSDGLPYALFACAGIVPWTYFSNAITSSSNSLVGSAQLITKVYFPRVIVPGAAVAAGLLDLAIGFALLIPLMFYYRVPLTPAILLLPFPTVLLLLLALAVGMTLAALNVRYRDVRYAVPFMIQLWMFTSPIIFPSSLVPLRLRWLLRLNPVTGIVDAYRAILFGHPIQWDALGLSALIAAAALLVSARFFRETERGFADVI